jgi:cell division protein FtsI (penicillin-binding protein 3)
LLFCVLAIFIVRLFYIQVIKHDHYRQSALAGQLKEYEIPAERGVIEAYDGENIVPIVLNEEVYTLFADPLYIKDHKQVAEKLAKITGGDTQEYEDKMRSNSRYAVLAKKLNENKKIEIEKLGIKGVGVRAESIRAYPQGSLAAQSLGFVNDEGKGSYGVEEFLDERLGGQPGQLKAITDAKGVPLVSNNNNILKDPVSGDRVLMTIDIGMQRKVEDMLREHLPSVGSESGSVVIMNPKNGAIKAMANWPTYNPSEFYKVSDAAVFTNAAVSQPMEVGSIMKTLSVAAALDKGVVNKDTSFFDPAKFQIDGATVRNVEEDGGPQTRTISDILRFSLNTGAIYLLKQMGGGEINQQARDTWHDYLVNHFRFGQKTNIEQGYEAEGTVPDPKDVSGINIQYANSTFGQGLNITPLQIAAAFSATINGGSYYKPHVIETADKKGELINDKVVKKEVSAQLRAWHENSVDKNWQFVDREGYRIGGKTGTAEIPLPEGGYKKDVHNGTFIGYVGGDNPEYVIVVRVNEPRRISFYAGTAAAAPLFGKISNMLIDNFSIRPISR